MQPNEDEDAQLEAQVNIEMGNLYREHPLVDMLCSLVGQESTIGTLKSISVDVLIPKWLFGGDNIRFQEDLAGGAMMDAGCYAVHAMRRLVYAAAGYSTNLASSPSRPSPSSSPHRPSEHPFEPVPISASAQVYPGAQTVDGAMAAKLVWPKWSLSAVGVESKEQQSKSGAASADVSSGRAAEGSEEQVEGHVNVSLVHGGLLPISDIRIEGASLSSVGVESKEQQSKGGSDSADVSSGRAAEGSEEQVEGHVNVSLVHGGLVLVSDIRKEGARGMMESKVFIAPFYMCRVVVVAAAAVLLPCYSPGELNTEETIPVSDEVAALMREDSADIIANARVIDSVYELSGLKKRVPWSQ
eukprot:gene27853-12030_t